MHDTGGVPLPNKLYLDALNFFHFFSFAEAIITANIALEVFIWRHLLERRGGVLFILIPKFPH